MGLFSLFGGSTGTVSIDDYLQKDAVIIDVRTEPEFYEGHAKGSKNIPLHIIADQISDIKKMDKPVITCCRSGARSGSAASILKHQGIDAINGGPWQNVASYIK